MGKPRNDLFPSTAWRFLLPDPAPRIVFVIGDEPPMLPDSFAGGDCSLGSAELVVGTSADTETLGKMFMALRPGGACYVEVSPPRWTNPKSLAKQLTDAGFVGVRMYSLTRTPHRTKVSWWMPLGQRFAQRHLLARHSNGGSRSRRAHAHILNRLSSAFPSLLDRAPWLTSPRDKWTLCAVAVKPATNSSAEPVTAPGIVPAELRRVDTKFSCLIALGGSSSDHPVIYLFTDSSPEPHAVVKVPMLPGEVADALAEAENLSALAKHSGLSDLVPTVLGVESHPEYTAVTQSYVPGPPLSRTISAETIDEVSAAVVAKLADLASATSRAASDSWINDLIDRALIEAEGTLSASAGPVVARTRQQLSGLEVKIQVCQHTDLGPWNMHRAENGSIGFIDWSEADLAGVPVCDAVHFLTHLVLIVDDGYATAKRPYVIANCVDPNHPRGQMIARCLGTYMNQLGLDSSQTNAFRLLTWLLATINRPATERPGSLYEQLWLKQLEVND